MNKRNLLAAPLALIATLSLAANDQDQISSRATGENSFEITLESKNTPNLTIATRRITPTVLDLCGGLEVDFGKYEFEEYKSITGSGDNDSLTFVQNIRCVSPTLAKPKKDIRTPQLANEEATEAVRSRVRELSQQQFAEWYAHVGTDASAFINSSDLAKVRKLAQPTVEGTPQTINLYKITIYDNPEGAPSSGIYVAVDYDNRIGNVAHHCGYMMWHSPDAVEFTLGRVESGTLGEDVMTKMDASAISTTLKALRCSNFYDN